MPSLVAQALRRMAASLGRDDPDDVNDALYLESLAKEFETGAGRA